MKVRTTKQYERAEKKYRKKHKDHKIGKIRELHIDRQYNDDWLLIYQIIKSEMILLLVNTGDHDSLNRIINE